ncbi:sporulation protein YunB [Lederbergia sp. NSJ-179]|uniref:sporulation protein YunB n=1 Tax=Lederbergia sp. NSJ-179 TaxID=2931402 RepID=UPI001FD5190A|nr:sporulation protein YunB [Lederbergia sp. NSJ-179]MCJ7840314.1 sporulation protein YunB [Lederbergia sp. NSJ-179]
MARFRTRRRQRGPLPLRYVLLLSFVFFIFSTVLGLWIANRGIKPTLINYAESQTGKIAPMVVAKAVEDVLPQVKDLSEVTESVPDEPGQPSIQYRTDVINKIQAELSREIQLNLNEAEKGNLEELEMKTGVEIDYDKSSEDEGIAYSFPLGQATNNALLGNLGPKIPIRFSAVGNVKTNVEHKVEHYPINNTFITVVVAVEVNVQIIIPFATKTAVVKQDVPIAAGFYRGDVPQFYHNGADGLTPSIEFPKPKATE